MESRLCFRRRSIASEVGREPTARWYCAILRNVCPGNEFQFSSAGGCISFESTGALGWTNQIGVTGKEKGIGETCKDPSIKNEGTVRCSSPVSYFSH